MSENKRNKGAEVLSARLAMELVLLITSLTKVVCFAKEHVANSRQIGLRTNNSDNNGDRQISQIQTHLGEKIICQFRNPQKLVAVWQMMLQKTMVPNTNKTLGRDIQIWRKASQKTVIHQ